MTDGAVWTLHRYADVHAALLDDRLVPYGVTARGDATHRVVREAVAQELPPALVSRWRESLGARADQLLDSLADGDHADMMHCVARPWAHEAVQQILQIPVPTIAACIPAATTLFEESALARGGAPSEALTHAAVQLSLQLEAFGGAGTVQSFVAMTHTVPSLIGAAMLALLQHPSQLEWLRSNHSGNAGRTVLAHATNELMRFAGPSRAVFRTAVAHVSIGPATIAPGDAVVLLLSHANRDPAVFVAPDQLDVQRTPAAHLAFGAGVHGCVGAQIVRMLLQEAIAAFVRSPRDVALDTRDGLRVAWLDGFALRAPKSVPVVVRARG